MNIEEAIKYLNEKSFQDYSGSPYIIAIEAMEKQIPKKPIYSNYDDNGFGDIIPYEAKCPTCEYEFGFGEFNEEDNHHCVCGQAIDWE